MSEIGFRVTETGARLTPDELSRLRRHYLTYVRATRDERRSLHADLDAIYSTIDGLVTTGSLADVARLAHDSDHVVLFATDSSTLSLREFQQAMLAEGRTVRMVAESSIERNGIRALGENDLLIVVTTSNAFAKRQARLITQSGAHKVLVTASREANATPEARALFDDILLIGEGCAEGSDLHRIYATYGVTYLFDCLFGEYALRYDPDL